jgi:hypothetical protein
MINLTYSAYDKVESIGYLNIWKHFKLDQIDIFYFNIQIKVDATLYHNIRAVINLKLFQNNSLKQYKDNL